MTVDKSKLTVLIVDDTEPMRKMIKDSLRMMGVHNVLMAENGEEALKRLHAHTEVGLVISDWSMPKMDGLTLLKHVRNHAEFKSLPFMMVTAETERSFVSNAVKAGVSQFIIKPFTYKDLQQRVNRILDQATQQEDDAEKPAVSTSRAARAEPFTSNHQNATVLIVDDAPSNIDVISGILKRTYRIKAATRAPKAISIAQSSDPPDLILMDIMMPDMNGIEACRQLKDDPDTAGIPIIFLTAKSSVDDVAEGFRAGGADYIVKPADPTILEARVANHISISQSRRDLQNYVNTLIENNQLREDVERITRHDIKSPLSAVISLSDALLESKEWDTQTTESLSTIRSSGYDALGMVNRTLDLYKMESGTYRVNPDNIDLSLVVKRVSRELQGLADTAGVRVAIKSESNCIALAEEGLCMSIVRNLLKNAIEASSKGDDVRVIVGRKKRINLMVHNEGVVPEELQARFFDKYATTGKAEGTGLGTYSARLMTEIQGGRIRFISNESQGTVLNVELPAAATD